MTQCVSPAPSPTPTTADDIGVLLVHGYTGTPQSMRPWAEHLAGAATRCALPRLPGHGTRWQDMNTTRWQDWYAEVDTAFGELRSAVAGLRRGDVHGRAARHQAGPRARAAGGGAGAGQPDLHARRPAARAAPDAAARRAVVPGHRQRRQDGRRRAWSWPTTGTPCKAMHSQTQLWAEVRRDLAEVTQPVLLMHSPGRPRRARWPARRCSSSTSPAPTSPRSGSRTRYHVATLDNDAPLIHDESVRFIERVAGTARADVSEG